MIASNTFDLNEQLRHNKIIATTPDPLYSDDLIEVELEFEAQFELANNLPLVCLNQLDKNSGQTILLESKDLYLTYDNFHQLLYTGLDFYAVLSNQDRASFVESEAQRTKAMEQTKALIDMLQDHYSVLEAGK